MPTRCQYLTAYVLWLVGGLFGWHHIYMRRPYQAVVYGQSLGGYGIGWLTDLFFIPRYLRESVNEAARAKSRAQEATWGGALSNVLSMGAMAYMYCIVVEMVWAPIHPTREIGDVVYRTAAYGILAAAATMGCVLMGRARDWQVQVLPTFGAACMWLAVTESRRSMLRDAAAREEVDPTPAAEEFTVAFLASVGACLGAFIVRRVPKTAPKEVPLPPPRPAPPVAAAAAARSRVGKGKEEAPAPAAAPAAPAPPVVDEIVPIPVASCCSTTARATGVMTAQGLWFTIIALAVISNADVPVDEDGNHNTAGVRSMKCGKYVWDHRESIRTQMHEIYTALYVYWQQRGWEGMQEDFAREFLKSDAADYSTLGLKEGATLGEVKAAYRKLARKNHPDAAPSEHKVAAAERFRKIVSAYERLSSKLGGRQRDSNSEASPPQGDAGEEESRAGSRGRRGRRRSGSD